MEKKDNIENSENDEGGQVVKAEKSRKQNTNTKFILPTSTFKN